jgi:hypothetical protein
MNVLVFSSFHLPPSFVGLNLEFIQRNLDDGNKVFLIDCNGSFKECGFNTFGLKYMCEICKFRENNGLKLLSEKVSRFSLNELISEEDKALASAYINNVEALQKDNMFNGFEVGEAVYSSYISKTRDRNFTSTSDQDVLKKLAYNSILSFQSILRFIKEKEIDSLFLFNGRWDYYRAALSAARKSNIEIDVFENYRKGGFLRKFGDNLPHSISKKTDLINECWDSEIDYEKKKKIADSYFHNKRKGKTTTVKNFTSYQTKGKLPVGYINGVKTFVLYNSSDDEIAAVGSEFDNPYFKDQTEGILFIADYFKNRPDIQLIIRMHPNLKGLRRSYLTPIYNLDSIYKNVHLVKPEEDVDSYQLLDVADTVITFGSSIGVEATFWEKPVILLGKSFFGLDVAHVPDARDGITDLINDSLIPKDKLNARKIAYYLVEGGEKAIYYNNKINGDIFFKNTLLSYLPWWFKLYYKSLKKLGIHN